MRRRLLLVVAVLLILLGSSLALDPVHASPAASVDDAGWWWRAQTNPGLLLPAPPTVAPGQLLVQGAPDQAAAIAAVAATLTEGEAKPVLTLKVAANGDTSGAGAIILACQAGSSWVGGDAKVWAEKPNPACGTGGVKGARSEDGTTWTFDLSALQFTDKVNVVLVPGTVEGQPEGANGSVFSLTFEKPTAASIATSPGTPPPPPTTTAPVDAGFTPPPDSGTVTFDSPSVDSGSFGLPPVALPVEEQELTQVAPSLQAQQPLLAASNPFDPRSEHAEEVGIAILVLGAGLVYLATRQTQVIGPEGVPGGLGRWASPRWGSPPSLRS